MFDIGFWELTLISVVALVVLGPERLPVAIRSLSKFINGARAMANGVKNELAQELKIQELQDNLKKAENMGMKDLSPDLKESVEELKKAAAEVQKPYSTDPYSHKSKPQETAASERELEDDMAFEEEMRSGEADTAPERSQASQTNHSTTSDFTK